MGDPSQQMVPNFSNAQQNVLPNQYSGGQYIIGTSNQQQFGNQYYQTEDIKPNSGNLNTTSSVMPSQFPPQLPQQVYLPQEIGQNNEQDYNNSKNVQNPLLSNIQSASSHSLGESKLAGKDISIDSLYRLGQKTVRDIVVKMLEFFATVKAIRPPNGTPQGNQYAIERKIKLQEIIKVLKILFRYLRVIYNRFNEQCQLEGLDYQHIESFIPMKDERENTLIEINKAPEIQTAACVETRELIEQIHIKNGQLKELINILRQTIREVNTMLSMCPQANVTPIS